MKSTGIITSIIGLCVFTLLLSACKKKDNSSSSSTTTTTTGTSTPGAVYGSLQASYSDYDLGTGNVTKDSLIIASFYASPNPTSLTTYVNAGTVTVNGINMIQALPQSYYLENTSVNMQTIVWSATGEGTVAPFSYSWTPIYPKISTPINIADTCYKSNGISVSLSGITNAGSVSVYLSQGSTSISKNSSSANGTISFNASELSGFATNNSLTIAILLTNLKRQAIGSVSYELIANHNYTKFSYLK